MTRPRRRQRALCGRARQIKRREDDRRAAARVVDGEVAGAEAAARTGVKSPVSCGRYGRKHPLVVFTRWKPKVHSLQRPQESEALLPRTTETAVRNSFRRSDGGEELHGRRLSLGDKHRECERPHDRTIPVTLPGRRRPRRTVSISTDGRSRSRRKQKVGAGGWHSNTEAVVAARRQSRTGRVSRRRRVTPRFIQSTRDRSCRHLKGYQRPANGRSTYHSRGSSGNTFNSCFDSMTATYPKQPARFDCTGARYKGSFNGFLRLRTKEVRVRDASIASMTDHSTTALVRAGTIGTSGHSVRIRRTKARRRPALG